MKAKVAIVRIGVLEFEALWLGGDHFFVSLDRVCQNLGTTTEDIEAIGIELRTPMNNALVNCVPLKDFERIILELAIAGNKIAQQMKRDLISMAGQQLFSDSFDIPFDANDRQQWLKACQQRRELKALAYEAVLGKSMEKLCQDLQVDPQNLRDRLNQDELRWLGQVEDLAMRLIDQDNLDPILAIKEACRSLRIPSVDRVA